MTKKDLAIELASYSFKDRMKVYRAAKLLSKYDKLTKEKLTKEEELAKELADFEEV